MICDHCGLDRANLRGALVAARALILMEKDRIVACHSLLGDGDEPLPGTLEPEAAAELAERFDPVLAAIDGALGAPKPAKPGS